MLDLQADVEIVPEDIANADMIAELEAGGELTIIVVVNFAEVMSADTCLRIPTLEAVVLKAEYRGETDVDEVLLVARNVAVAVAAPLRHRQIPIAADMRAVRLPPFRIPFPLQADTRQLGLVPRPELQ